MTVSDLLKQHLRTTFGDEQWHPPLATAVYGLTAAQAAWKPSAERHSIWQIVRHIIHWKQGVLRALAGEPPDYERMTAEDWPEAAGDQTAWEADVRMLHDIHEAFSRRLEDLGEDVARRTVRAYQQSAPVVVAARLLGVFTHDAYHAGQIQYLRALQGIPLDRLFTAAWEGDVSRLQQLLDQEPDLVHAYNGDGWTALHVASYAGQEGSARLLLDRGADAGARSRNERASTALHAAVGGWQAGRRVPVVGLLLDHGADRNAADGAGNTPLHLAAGSGDAAVVEFLLRRGAAVNVRRKDGQTPLGVAEGHGAVEVLLRNAGGTK